MKNLFKNFKLKKLLQCISYSIIFTTFLGFTFIFINSVFTYSGLVTLSSLDPQSETVISVGKSFEESYNFIEEEIQSEKLKYGENYPAAGLYICSMSIYNSTNMILTVYSIAFLSGITLGSLIYIITIEKATKLNLVIKSIFAFIGIFLLGFTIDFIYTSILHIILKLTNTNFTPEYKTSLYTYSIEELLIPFLVILGIVYILNIIQQCLLTRKLNKELNKIEKNNNC